MVTRLLELNAEFTAQPQPGVPVACVLVRGAGGKAFCAGGDVKDLVIRARAGTPDPAAGVTFFRIEYANNLAIAQLPVPYVALLDGIVMGGGVGVSYHGSFRVATERTVLAMPECAIGLFPDIGASFFLHRLPGQLGRYMGLTGERLTGAEVKDAGFATHYLPSARLPELEAALVALGARAADPAEVDRLLRGMEAATQDEAARVVPRSSALLEWKLPHINAHFGRSSVAAVVESLEAGVAAAERDAALAAGADGGGPAAEVLAFLRSTLAAMRRGSPLSHAVTWEMLRRSASQHLSLRQCLEMDFALAARCVHGQADFLEGVRAVLIDKDNKPAWRYGRVQDVPEGVVAAMFAPLTDEPPLFGGAPEGQLASRM
ncbi:hypothetical protein HYH03_000702 [Edaphochlamys debaryana]|uniref:3-hydroxyisobutyryl-CoA hydrolase n=1 Tax=Edaphochlamys debaryana TaxID=47281 RepID=A0A835YGN8_9CHLO|nr:hypothetical protein HYH03_000702 [Edaphochlamys debaryana]|eukprot:KAG2502216.1 hypothetical protein HYH03_000702 [Edaphochlamys debaryana]